MIGELLTIIAPILICAAIGFSWIRVFKQPYDTGFITNLVTNVGVPSLIFSSLTNGTIAPDAFGAFALAAALTMVGMGLLAWPILRMAGLPWRTYLTPMIYGNAGNMGLPLCLFAFGKEGLGFAIGFFAVSAVSQFTIGAWVLSGQSAGRFLLRQPAPWSVVVALIFVLGELHAPLFLANTTHLIGGFTIPLMLITLGVSLARMKATRPLGTLGLAVLRSGGGFLIALFLGRVVFGFEGVALGVLLVEASMPVAVFNYLFAQRYNRSPEDIASLVVTSTLLAFLFLPGLLWVAIHLSGGG
ncbi:transporter [Tistrella bauzanensis]|uniref:Transporter n=1 Tax=Tistrella bauzanensis TaxID=657419 RepID=A0ABQ1IC83_9PROT|nr:AEC family transporter [Tistrella bauzanensis]GGB31437.1 transporter [Tistrella bauzanensis]